MLWGDTITTETPIKKTFNWGVSLTEVQSIISITEHVDADRHGAGIVGERPTDAGGRQEII